MIWINKQDEDLNGYISIPLQNHQTNCWFGDDSVIGSKYNHLFIDLVY